MVHMVWYGTLINFFSAAIDKSTGKSVAIKKINQLNSLLVARRTLRELKLLRHLKNHENV